MTSRDRPIAIAENSMSVGGESSKAAIKLKKRGESMRIHQGG
jgi:hypothetical protein